MREKIEQVKAELERERKDYVEMDYKKNKAYKRLGKFFGTFFKEKRDSTRETDSDVAYYRAHYDQKLFEYKTLLLDEAKADGASNIELGNLVKSFAAEDFLNLADTNLQVKIEHNEGKLSGFVKEHSMELVQNYRKLSLAKKLAIGAAFGGGAALLAGGGAIAAGIAVSAVAVRRAFMGLVMGTTVAIGMESRDRKKAEQAVEKEADEFAKSLEGLSDEERYKKALENAERALTLSEDNRLESEKNKNLRNLATGALVGTFIGSGYASELFGGAGRRIAGLFGYHAEVPTGGAGAAVEHVDKNIDLEAIKDGGNIQASIRNYYRLHPDLIDKYNELHGGGKKFDAGQIAERLWHESGMDKDLVHEGAQVHLSPDGMHLVSVTGDDNMGYLPEKEIETPAETDSVPEAEADADESPAPESPATPEIPEGGTGEYAMDPQVSEEIDKIGSDATKISGQLEELDDKILKLSSGQYESVSIWPNPEKMLENLREEKQSLEIARQTLFDKMHNGYFGMLRDNICGSQENFSKIKGLSASSIIDEKGSVHKFVQKILDSDDKRLGKLRDYISDPENKQQTFGGWMYDVSKIMRDLGIKKI